MRRLLLVLAVAAVMAAIMLALAVPAFADATLNDNNCLGSGISNRNPGIVNNGDQGEFASGEAQDGVRGDNVSSGVATRANCGDNPG